LIRCGISCSSTSNQTARRRAGASRDPKWKRRSGRPCDRRPARRHGRVRRQRAPPEARAWIDTAKDDTARDPRPQAGAIRCSGAATLEGRGRRGCSRRTRPRRRRDAITARSKRARPRHNAGVHQLPCTGA
jgi:hypothetical protein